MSTLQEKVAAIRAIKEEYDVGSQDALRYFRVVEAYSELTSKFSDKFRAKDISNTFSLRHVSNLCYGIRRVVLGSLWIESINRALELESNKEINHNDVQMYCPSKNPGIFSKEEDRTYWEFDYEKFLDDFTDAFSKTPDKAHAMTYAFETFMSSTHKYLTNFNTKISFPEFKSRDDLLLGRKERRKNKANTLSNIAGQKDFMKFVIESDLERNLDGPTLEEQNYIMNYHRLFERANREGVLHELDVQRKIALHYLLTDHNQIEEYREWKGLSVPQWIIERGLNQAREEVQKTLPEGQKFPPHYLEKLTYIVRAIMVNKKWLERMLS